MAAAGAAVGLFALAVVVGLVLRHTGHPVRAPAAPLFARWLPHLGPGTPAAVAVAALVIARGPALAARLSWGRLAVVAYLAALSWIAALALVDGWQRGVADRLTDRHEYLTEVPGVHDIPAMLGTFTDRILDFQPDSWTTHVSGHPPGALLVFVGLDRAGLGGGGWAGLCCLLVGASVAVSVPITLRLLAGDHVGRSAVPFLVLFPGAVWIGSSADGLFAGVAAAGLALLAYAVRRGGTAGAVVAVAAGLVLGFTCFLSYGLVLIAPIAAAVVVAGRRVAAAPWAAVGATAVFAVFAAAGFSWLDGYHLVVERYYQGIAADRPYAYWVWGNLACLVASAGPAAAPILRRVVAAATRQVRRRGGDPSGRWLLLPLSAGVAILLADVSGLSKAEVERIWLPFAIWLPAGAALLPPPAHRAWLAVQAVAALVVNHLLLTPW